MVNKYSYKILQEKELIIEYVSGEITWKDVIESKKRLIQDENYNPNFDIIDDIRDLDIHFEDKSEIQEFIDFANKQSDFLGTRKSAVLKKSPNQFVNSEILFSLNKSLPISFRTFSTLSAAAKWIGIPIAEIQEIKQSFEDLKT